MISSYRDIMLFGLAAHSFIAMYIKQLNVRPLWRDTCLLYAN